MHTAGERNGQAVLDEAKVRHIRRECNFREGVGFAVGSVKRMAEKYEISEAAVRAIARRERWGHVE